MFTDSDSSRRDDKAAARRTLDASLCRSLFIYRHVESQSGSSGEAGSGRPMPAHSGCCCGGDSESMLALCGKCPCGRRGCCCGSLAWPSNDLWWLGRLSISENVTWMMELLLRRNISRERPRGPQGGVGGAWKHPATFPTTPRATDKPDQLIGLPPAQRPLRKLVPYCYRRSSTSRHGCRPCTMRRAMHPEHRSVAG